MRSHARAQMGTLALHSHAVVRICANKIARSRLAQTTGIPVLLQTSRSQWTGPYRSAVPRQSRSIGSQKGWRSSCRLNRPACGKPTATAGGPLCRPKISPATGSRPLVRLVPTPAAEGLRLPPPCFGSSPLQARWVALLHCPLVNPRRSAAHSDDALPRTRKDDKRSRPGGTCEMNSPGFSASNARRSASSRQLRPPPADTRASVTWTRTNRRPPTPTLPCRWPSMTASSRNASNNTPGM